MASGLLAFFGSCFMASTAILRSCSMTSAGQSASEIETGAMAVACMATVWATSAGTSLLKPSTVPSFLLKCT